MPRIPLFQPYVNVAMQKNISGYQYWFHRRLDSARSSRGNDIPELVMPASPPGIHDFPSLCKESRGLAGKCPAMTTQVETLSGRHRVTS